MRAIFLDRQNNSDFISLFGADAICLLHGTFISETYFGTLQVEIYSFFLRKENMFQ